MTLRVIEGGKTSPFVKSLKIRVPPREAMLEALVRDLLHGWTRLMIAKLSMSPDRIAHADADMSTRAIAAESMLRRFPDPPGAA